MSRYFFVDVYKRQTSISISVDVIHGLDEFDGFHAVTYLSLIHISNRHTIQLWFDVGIKRYTTLAKPISIGSKLWFDVDVYKRQHQTTTRR